MIRALRFLMLVATMVVVAGCVGPVPKIDSSPRALANVKTIALIRSPEPKTYTVQNFGHPGMAFGLIGGLIVAADLSSKRDRLTQTIKEKSPTTISNTMANSIVDQLLLRGFDVNVEDGPWEENDGKFTIDFEKITSSADAVLVVAPSVVGFVATGATTPYLPTITAIATLLGKDRKEPLYRGFLSSGWHPKADGWRSSSPTATFGGFDALMADPTRTAGSLNSAASQIATMVAQDLKR